MEILSTSGKKYLIEEKFAPEFIKVLISDDFAGQRILPDNFSDQIYDIVFKFFNTGRIDRLDEEIISALDFLGYDIPEFGFSSKYPFPDDYKRIWLEDDWIKNNLYKLPDLGISRLIKLSQICSTNPLFSGKLVDFNYINRDSILNYCFEDIIDRIKKYPLVPAKSNFYLAGGSVLNAIIKQTYISDYDYFYVNQDATEGDFRTSMIEILKMKTFIKTDNSITIKDQQYIQKIYQSIAEVVFGFDIGVCAMIYYQEEIYLTPRCLYELKNRTIIADLKNISASYEYRLVKYMQSKKFNLYIPGFDKSKVNFKLLEELKQKLKYGKYTVKYCYEQLKIIIDTQTEEIVCDGLDMFLFLFYVKKVKISTYDRSIEINYQGGSVISSDKKRQTIDQLDNLDTEIKVIKSDHLLPISSNFKKRIYNNADLWFAGNVFYKK